MDAHAETGTGSGQLNGFVKRRSLGQKARTRKYAFGMAFVDGFIHFAVNTEIVGVYDYSVHPPSPQKIKSPEVKLAYFMQAAVTVGQAERLKGRVNTGKGSFREGHFIFFFQSVHGSYKGGPRQNGRRRHRRIPLALRHLNNRPALHSLAQSVEDIVVPAELIDY